MVDSELSLDLEQAYSPPKVQKHTTSAHTGTKKSTRHASGVAKPPSSWGFKSSSAAAKDAYRQHRALERQFSLAQQKSRISDHHGPSPLAMPALDAPEATFTRTAVGVWAGEGLHPMLSCDIQYITVH